MKENLFYHDNFNFSILKYSLKVQKLHDFTAESTHPLKITKNIGWNFATQSIVCTAAVSTFLGRLLEMQNNRHHPILIELESVF